MVLDLGFRVFGLGLKGLAGLSPMPLSSKELTYWLPAGKMGMQSGDVGRRVQEYSPFIIPIEHTPQIILCQQPVRHSETIRLGL